MKNLVDLALRRPVTIIVATLALSIASILAVHYRVINLRLALAITLLGCIAPFFGTIEFLLQSHRRKLAEADAEAVAS